MELQTRSTWRPALTVFAGVNLLDVVSTWLGMDAGLPEGNFLPSLLISLGGIELMFLFKAAAFLLVVLAVLWLGPRFPRVWYAVYVGNVILALVVLINLSQIVSV